MIQSSSKQPKDDRKEELGLLFHGLSFYPNKRQLILFEKRLKVKTVAIS